jgi:hypothetical protein
MYFSTLIPSNLVYFSIEKVIVSRILGYLLLARHYDC